MNSKPYVHLATAATAALKGSASQVVEQGGEVVRPLGYGGEPVAWEHLTRNERRLAIKRQRKLEMRKRKHGHSH